MGLFSAHRLKGCVSEPAADSSLWSFFFLVIHFTSTGSCFLRELHQSSTSFSLFCFFFFPPESEFFSGKSTRLSFLMELQVEVEKTVVRFATSAHGKNNRNLQGHVPLNPAQHVDKLKVDACVYTPCPGVKNA